MPVYFDNNATTRLDPRVLEAMLPYLSGPYGNASSLHRFGRAARDAVERAREQLAVLVNCQPREIIWTSGGTESNNLALKGVTDGAVPSRVLYGATEHPAVLEAAESRSEEHTSELQSLMRISYAVFCLKKKNKTITRKHIQSNNSR